MDVTPLIREGQKIIQSYAGGVFKVSGSIYKHAIIVTPEYVNEWPISDVGDVSSLSLQHFSNLIEQEDKIDVLLLGSGKVMAFLPPKLKMELKKAGLCVDIMDSGAACRTYNVLMAEGRRVVCALLPT